MSLCLRLNSLNLKFLKNPGAARQLNAEVGKLFEFEFFDANCARGA